MIWDCIKIFISSHFVFRDMIMSLFLAFGGASVHCEYVFLITQLSFPNRNNFITIGTCGNPRMDSPRRVPF